MLRSLFLFIALFLSLGSVAEAQESHGLDSLLGRLIDNDSLPQPRKEPLPSYLDRLDSLAKLGLRLQAYPGCQIYALHHGKVIYDRAFGSMTRLGEKTGDPNNPFTIYDLASITKAAATTPALMLLVAEHKVNLNAPLLSYLPETKGSLLGMVTIRQLLLHQSGLPAGINFYTDLIDEESYEGALIRYKAFKGGVPLVGKAWGNPHFRFLDQYIASKRSEQHSLRFSPKKYIAPSFKDRMMERLLSVRVKANKSYHYSDLNFILLQQVIERVSQQGLDTFVQEHIYRPIGARLYYCPLEHGVKAEVIAPAQDDRFLRGEILRGTVDDEAAACLGGVSGNAGLFGSARELAKVAQLLLQHGVWEGKTIIPSRTVKLFTETLGAGGARCLGFDKPRKHGGPTGELASHDTYGHQGFTGTCFWVDPRYDLVFVFLSNRTYPSRKNTVLIHERLRQNLQDLLYESLGIITPRT